MKKILITMALLLSSINCLSAIASDEKEADLALSEYNKYTSDLKKGAPVSSYFSRIIVDENLNSITGVDFEAALANLVAVRKVIRFGDAIDRVIGKKAFCDSTLLCNVMIEFYTKNNERSVYTVRFRRNPSDSNSAYKIVQLELNIGKKQFSTEPERDGID